MVVHGFGDKIDGGAWFQRQNILLLPSMWFLIRQHHIFLHLEGKRQPHLSHFLVM